MGAVKDEEDRLLEKFLSEEADKEKAETSNEDIGWLIDKIQGAYISLWAALIVGNSVLIGAILTSKPETHHILFWFQKSIVVLSLASIVLLILANIDVINAYEHIHKVARGKAKPKNIKQTWKNFQKISIFISSLALVLLLIELFSQK